ncbi:MAG: GMC family oxidoreductase, partial [Chitinophagaceae bacterium]
AQNELVEALKKDQATVYKGDIPLEPPFLVNDEKYVGPITREDLKEALSVPSDTWYFGITGFGEMLPDHSNKMTLNKSVTDKWGLPVLDFDVEIKENEKKMREDMKNDAVEMLTAAGVKDVNGNDWGYAVGMGIHEMGTARMGRDPKSSVLNGNNQVWDAPNVFVTDGACMTSASCVNPSLTYMAMTARAADFAVSELKKQNL